MRRASAATGYPAAKLRPWPTEAGGGGAWELRHPGGATQLFVDPADVVNDVRGWVKHAVLAAGADQRTSTSAPPAPPLVITGRAMAGASEMLRSLLGHLVAWARQDEVPVRASALQDAKVLRAKSVSRDNAGELGEGILSLLHAVEAPVLVLWDEVEHLLLPPRVRGDEVYEGGWRHIRDTFMKRLLLNGPRSVLWCITGSGLAHTWIGHVSMPNNGFMPETGAYTVDLAATHSPSHMSLVWGQLVRLYDELRVELDPSLLRLCPPSAALLTTLVEQRLNTLARNQGAEDFAREYTKWHIAHEFRVEMAAGLARAPPAQRLAMLDMAFWGVGARVGKYLSPGLRRFLEPHVEKTDDGRWYLRSTAHRQALRFLIRKDGSMWRRLGEEFSAPLEELDAGWVLMRLGQTADYLFGHLARRRWEGKQLPAGALQFKNKLQAMSDEIANKLVHTAASRHAIAAGGGGAMCTRELWAEQPWFERALQSRWNSHYRDWFNHDDHSRELDSHLAMLVFYLRLSSNRLARMELGKAEAREGREEEAGAPEDCWYLREVITALPSVLGQPLDDFIGTVQEGLRPLSSHTVEDAVEASSQE
ncbi:hypothetical protein GPECTOR_13g801 [Gonium pectorale]|uniref:Uncharacterized protein n=1 Tax=Gonium pectorale TaxID=33097 RepID=A0A150GND5_GONPE|nr:hypothetical protein GPECTOR_13g801 [Gonium pectorale]|eukprot:KXZ51314.1 hypothetical protein GPECTOR_13g801 [Gonium pectorale]